MLNEFLRFDTADEAVEFAKTHDFDFSTDNPKNPNVPETPYLLLNRNQRIPSPRVPHSFSGQLVERKRTGQSLPFVIHNTIFEQPTGATKDVESSPDSLFVESRSLTDRGCRTIFSRDDGPTHSSPAGTDPSAFGTASTKPASVRIGPSSAEAAETVVAGKLGLGIKPPSIVPSGNQEFVGRLQHQV